MGWRVPDHCRCGYPSQKDYCKKKQHLSFINTIFSHMIYVCIPVGLMGKDGRGEGLLYGQGHDACCMKQCQTSTHYTETWILLDSIPQSVAAEDTSKAGALNDDCVHKYTNLGGSGSTPTPQKIFQIYML